MADSGITGNFWNGNRVDRFNHKENCRSLAMFDGILGPLKKHNRRRQHRKLCEFGSLRWGGGATRAPRTNKSLLPAGLVGEFSCQIYREILREISATCLLDIFKTHKTKAQNYGEIFRSIIGEIFRSFKTLQQFFVSTSFCWKCFRKERNAAIMWQYRRRSGGMERQCTGKQMRIPPFCHPLLNLPNPSSAPK